LLRIEVLEWESKGILVGHGDAPEVAIVGAHIVLPALEDGRSAVDWVGDCSHCRAGDGQHRGELGELHGQGKGESVLVIIG